MEANTSAATISELERKVVYYTTVLVFLAILKGGLEHGKPGFVDRFMDFASALDGIAGGRVWGRIFERCMVIRDYLKRRDLKKTRAEELDQDLKEWEENALFWDRRYRSRLQRVRVAELEETKVDDGTPAGRRSKAAGSHSGATASNSGAAASSVKSAKTITLGSDTSSSQSDVSGQSDKQDGTTESGSKQSITTLPLASSMEPSMRGLAASAA